MFVNLPVYVLGKDSHVGEEVSKYIEFLHEELYPLLQSLVLFEQEFNFFLGLSGAHLRLLSTLSDGNVIPLAPPAILVAVLITRFDGLSRHVVVVQHGSLIFHVVHVHGVVEDRGGEGGEGRSVCVGVTGCL